MLARSLNLSTRILSRPISSVLAGNFNLTEDQLAFQETALQFAKEHMEPFANEWDKTDHFPIDVIKMAGNLGFGAIYCSDKHGGTGLGKLEASIILEALSTGCISTASYISIHNMCNGLLDVFGTEEQRSKWQPGVSSFDLFTSYCLTEPNSGSDAGAMSTTAKLEGNDYVLNGSKMFISGGGESHLYFVMTRTGPKEISCFIVEKDTPGLSFGKKEDKLGWRTQPTRLVNFDNCKIPKGNLLGEIGQGMKIAMRGLEGGRLTISSCALGGAWYALEKASNYMGERKQFGKHLKDFQYLRFKMAEALARLTSARMTTRACAQLMDQPIQNKHIFASIAKLIATDDCAQIVDDCLQMFGGYGLLREYGMERMYRELRVLKIVEGTNEIMRHTIAKNLFDHHPHHHHH
ncbi:unnamed protein product [Blepharisma stoltei]|uniref:Isobutyryl-CoA dehydrogenase, mitochondrial n=1 Tax=Blepharisma stoltei TaxID=1481888 RepID=A0AAU9JHG7_9CILI|nr:unnamed protein product [Blepharisma stoltei]